MRAQRGDVTVEVAAVLPLIFFVLFTIIVLAKAIALQNTLDYVAIQTSLDIKYGSTNVRNSIAKVSGGLSLFIDANEIRPVVTYYSSLADYPSNPGIRQAGSIAELTLMYQVAPELPIIGPSLKDMTLSSSAVVRIEE